MTYDNGDDNVVGLLRNENYLDIINSFAQSLMSANSINEVAWCVTENAISQLGYYDCIVYLIDETNKRLVQMSAYGPKKDYYLKRIKKPIVIKPGEGIVGSVFISGKGEIVNDTSLDPRYIEDDAQRFSEVTVPIIIDNQVVGVIDSEHPNKNFFTEDDFKLLTTISNLVSIKMEKIRENLNSKNELESILHVKTKELKTANEDLVEQNRVKEVLIKEIHHRVKNNMQIIISLLNMQMNVAKTENERMVFKECSDRMYSIANIHGKLYFEKNVLKIPIEEFLYELGSTLIVSYYLSKKIDLVLDIDVQDVSLDTGIPLGLIVNEFMTHSIKLGFPEGIQGFVKIRMRQNGDKFIVNYSDNTEGFDPKSGDGSQVGIELIDILVDQLDGELISKKSDTGTHIKLIIPK